MPRRARFAPPGLFLHLTQRGNCRQRTFFTDADRRLYLGLVSDHASERKITIAGYCIMSNHVHLLAKAEHEGAISAFMKGVSGEYAQMLHGRLGRKGRFWQGRFHSSVLDEWHMTNVLRYIERNPVRAEMVRRAEEYPWSSASAHLNLSPYPEFLDQPSFTERWTAEQWRALVYERQAKGQVAEIRLATRTERPLGSEEFVRQLSSQWNVTFKPALPSFRNRRPVQRESAPVGDRLLAGA